MIDWLVLGSTLAFTILYSVVEANHDYYVIKNDKGYNKTSRAWHKWGWFQNALAFVPLTVGLFAYDWRLAIPLTIANGVLFWQLHDSIIGYKLTKKWWHMGTTGADNKLMQIFQNGKQFAVIRSMFIGTAILDATRVIRWNL